MKKQLSVIAAAAMLISAMPMSVSMAADEYFTDGPRTVRYDAVEPNKAYDYNSYTEASRDAYKFTVGNENFSLLDVNPSNNNSKYFVMSNTVYGKHNMTGTTENYFQHAVNGSGNVFEGTATSWLKDEFANSYPTFWLNSGHFYAGYGLENKQPDVPRIANDIRAYLDTNHVWTCEPAPNAATPNDTYTFKAGLAFPSVNEVWTYQDRITFAGSAGDFASRTMINYKNGTASTRFNGYIRLNQEGGVEAPHWDLPSWQNVRPCFWLKDGFFANVAVDLDTAGAAVKQEIKKVGYDKLVALYGASDVKTKLGMEPFTATTENIGGFASDEAAEDKTAATGFVTTVTANENATLTGISWSVTSGETKSFTPETMPTIKLSKGGWVQFGLVIKGIADSDATAVADVY